MTPEKQASSRAAGYIRVSQERAVRNGYGLGAQERDIQKFIEYKSWNLVELFREEGVSGYRRDRPALERMLAGVKAGRFDVVVFPSIDRAGRSVKDVIEIDRAIRKAGADTVFLREGVDTSTPTGELFRNIMASLAEFEGRIIYERLSKGKKQKASQGGYVGGWLAYGYRNGDGRISVVPKEAKAIERVFRWRAGGKSFTWIAAQLNAEKVKTRKGGPWQSPTVRTIVANRFYTGRVGFEGEYIKGRHEAIISDELFQACQINSPTVAGGGKAEG